MNSHIMNEDFARANERARKRKIAQDKEVAAKKKTGGVLIVYTGAGKGKSTAAFGLLTRALGHGLKIAVVQFTKGKWSTGERLFFQSPHLKDNIAFFSMGDGFTWETQDKAQDIDKAQAAWQKAVSLIEEARATPPRWNIILLDELNHILRYGYLDETMVLNALRERPAGLHVVVTGRSALASLIAMADTVTEMKNIHHAYQKGFRAQKGIEF